ncbi:MAG: 2-succinyl-5-enolpyruvyl-6-hydroxy-3-cyclohexene-1-carboxylic-acid synthase [Bergeyella sp.]|nr:2-succinyl-5-enolpyruvyl-6-hydroxy-3-cyclohexene-1-carboxylic-acid synthase [Bergeyella sp.]
MKRSTSKISVQLLSQVAKEFRIADIVISPGSRNAPLSIHFVESGEFSSYSVIDERSAGFVALGMAKKTQLPVMLSCTSGSATANYYPAITEAFYHNIPLLILTADRPVTFVDIFDGQTIRQKDIFKNHVYGGFELLEDSQELAQEKNLEILKKTFSLCIKKQGPVHLNIPLSEPLYQYATLTLPKPRISKQKDHFSYLIAPKDLEEWKKAKRILILVGSQKPSKNLNKYLRNLSIKHKVVVLSENISNVYDRSFFSHIDRYIFGFREEDYLFYTPDLLITIGQNIISKKVKDFLRKSNPKNHWHLDPYWQPNTYFCLTKKIETKAEDFLSPFLKKIESLPEKPKAYYSLWEKLKKIKDEKHEKYTQQVPFSDFMVFDILSGNIPSHYTIHFSNSSSIRYAQLFDFNKNEVYCNRGTSGIEGCTSTAVGFAIKSKNPVVLVTGDISFFYDLNGLWNPYIPSSFRLILINNQEGSIFRIIPGPDKTEPKTLENFIATRHEKTAQHIAKHFDFDYCIVKEKKSLEKYLKHFFTPHQKPKILEISTGHLPNAKVLKDYFSFLG